MWKERKKREEGRKEKSRERQRERKEGKNWEEGNETKAVSLRKRQKRRDSGSKLRITLTWHMGREWAWLVS